MATTLSAREVSTTIDKTIKSTNPRDLPLKGLYFGRLWHNAREYKNAAEWILKYLRKYDRDASAYRLLGECYEQLDEYEAALSSYKRSLQVKPNQYDLVLHIVELFLDPGPTQNPTKAQVWLDKAAIALPGDTRVFKLKMELLLAQQASPNVLEDAILTEINKRPTDFSLHIQYVSFMRTQNRLADAYAYCNKMNNTLPQDIIEKDRKWCSCVVDTLKEYAGSLGARTASNDFIAVHCLFLEALSRLVLFRVNEKKHQKALEKLSIMDKFLWSIAAQHSGSEWQVVIEELKAQMCWLVAIFILDQAQMNKLSWSKAIKLATLLCSYSVSKPIPSLSSAWAVHTLSLYRSLPSRLRKNASIRMSQCCHMLWILTNKIGDQWSSDMQPIEGSEWMGKQVHRCLFGETADTHSSFLYNSQIVGKNLATPQVDSMAQYDEIAATSGDLQLLIWLGLRWSELVESSDFFLWATQAFPDLKLSTNNTRSSASVLSLNLLDVEAFIAACVFTMEKKARIWNEASAYDESRLSCVSLPLVLCHELATEFQENWWNAALKFSRKTEKLSAYMLKPVLQRGLECLRGIGNHGLETSLVMKLAKYFAAKAFSLVEEGGTSTRWYNYQRRAALYWSIIVPDLTRLSNGRTTEPFKCKDCLFASVFKQPTSEEALSLLSEAYMCHGELAVQENRIDEALSFYGKATLPQASFSQAHVYKKLADKILNDMNTGTPVFDGEKKHEQFIKKRRRCLEVTLSRLQQYPDEELHERTVRLLSSPHISPTRSAAKQSENGPFVAGPSSQSTPKANEHLIPTLVDKDSVVNLADTITALTSAMSSLQMEVSHLREENSKLRLSSLSMSAQSTPQHPMSAMQEGMHPAMMPSIPFHGQTSTPRPHDPSRPFIIHNGAMYPATGMDGAGRVGMSPAMQAQQFDNMRQAQTQAYYHNQMIPSSYHGNYQNFTGSPGVVVNNFGMSVNRYPQPDVGYATPPPGARQNAPASFPNNNQVQNLFAASLQNKEGALQQRLESVLHQVSPASHPSKPASFTPAKQQMDDRIMHPQSTTSNPGGVTLLENLLLDPNKASGSSVTSSTKEAEQFLSKFVTPRSPGAYMKFQSPEQMDRENQELEAQEQADADSSSHNDTGPHFDPIIPLPDLVEVKTGEEEEEALFSERCRLFRWDSGQWKERGVGVMKLLQHKITGKSRLLMRRDQVHKLCCNHAVVATLSLVPMSNSDRAMLWCALDFADETVKNEKFAARFKTSEIAKNFQEVVNAESSKARNKVLTPNKNSNETPSKPSKSPASESNITQTIEAGAAKFKFETFKPSPVVQKPPSPVSTQPEKPKESIFSNLAGALSSSSFGGSGPNGGIKPGLFKYSFGTKPKSRDTSANTSSVISEQPASTSASPEHEQEKDHESSDHAPGFEPLANLPELVSVSTGEENEEVVFCERAKLYRFVEPEWKERGLGDMKILKHKETGKYRIVMRREEVLNLCANHYILSNMLLVPQGKLEKAWAWIATDYSDHDDPKQQMLAARFKTIEQAKEFRDIFTRATSAEVEASSKSSVISDKSNPFAFDASSSAQGSSSSFRFDQPTSVSPGGDVMSLKTKTSTTDSTVQGGFKMPTQPTENWDCPVCAVSNSPDLKACQCCHCPNPTLPEQPKKDTSTLGGIKFGISSTDKPASLFGANMNTSNSSTLTASSKSSVISDKSNPFAFDASSSAQGSSSSFRFDQPTSVSPGGDVMSLKTKTSTTDSTVQGGFKMPTQPTENWDCPVCAVSNSPDLKACQCCHCPNPTLPEQPKEDTSTLGGIKFGISSTDKPASLFGANMNTSNSSTLTGTSQSTNQPKFSFGTGSLQFGLPSASASDTKEQSRTQHPALQRAGGTQSPGSFLQGSTMKFGIPNSSASNNPPTFGYSPQSAIFDNQSSGSQTRPCFPTIKDGSDDSDEVDQESSDDDSYSTYGEEDDSEDYEYDDDGDDDDDEPALTIDHSPLNRPPQVEEQATSVDGAYEDSNVIYCGELLPSKELQEKAKNLQLPPHFYNYLEKGNGSDGESSDSLLPNEKSAPNLSEGTSDSQKIDEAVPKVAATIDSLKSGFTFGSSSTVSFAQLAANNPTGSCTFNSQSVRNPAAFQPDTQPLFSQTAEHSNEQYQDDARDIYVKPIIDLPKNVAVVTGEEGETTIFCKKAKLFRFDDNTSQWKERGVGDIHVKHNPSTNRFRIVMRRDQVLKVCANHFITTEMRLHPSANSDRVWTWIAPDFSDNGDTPVIEKFAIRFKTVEFAHEFKESVEECQLLLNGNNDKKKSQSGIMSTSLLISNAEKMKSELGFFKDKMSVKSGIDFASALAKDLGTENEERFSLDSVQLTPLVKQHEKEKERRREQNAQVYYADRTDDASVETESTSSSASHVKIGLNKFEFKLNVEAQKQEETSQSPGISFSSATSDGSETDNIHFEPLLDKVTVSTGEENTQVLFEERARLYMYCLDSNQWKERGLGSMRILQDLDSKKLRLVMRREQVLKVCLNHYVMDTMEFKFKEKSDQKVLMWIATDFSDTDKINGELLQFAIRFKTAEIAAQFKLGISDGREAAKEGRLLDPISLHDLSAYGDESVTSEGGEEQPKTPYKSPLRQVKPAFSFANVESPFAKKDVKFGGFVFGDPSQSKPTTSTPSATFNFDVSSISFNIGSRRTHAFPQPPPSVSVAVQPTPSVPTVKSVVSKTLFESEDTSVDVSTTSAVSKSISASNDAPFTFKLPTQSPSLFGLAAGNAQQFHPPNQSTKGPAADLVGKDDAIAIATNKTDEYDDDVIFVWEAIPTEDQRRRADKLQLPPTFFLLESKDNNDGEFDSEAEEAILDYIDRRDNKTDYESSSSEEEDYEYEEEEIEGESNVLQDTPPPEKETLGFGLAQSETSGDKVSITDATQRGGNLFENYANMSGFSFASMAATIADNKHAFGSRKDAAFTVSDADKVLFTGKGEAQDVDPEAYSPEYKPVLKEPPPLVVIKTGEEEEEILFKERCKLYKFDSAANAWKERGLGEYKILYHPENQWYRVVMRREQVLKVCANHMIKKDTKLFSQGEKSWMYVAQDKSEGEPALEKFAVRFKTPQIAQTFFETWVTAQENLPDV